MFPSLHCGIDQFVLKPHCKRKEIKPVAMPFYNFLDSLKSILSTSSFIDIVRYSNVERCTC